MMDRQDQRREPRIALDTPVFVELPESAHRANAGAPSLLCRLVDISANGAQIRLDRALPVGAVVRLSAQLPDHVLPLTVVGEVRWARLQGDRFLVGFSLYEAGQTDIKEWKSLVARRL